MNTESVVASRAFADYLSNAMEMCFECKPAGRTCYDPALGLATSADPQGAPEGVPH